MKCHRGQLIIILACLVVYSCTIFEKDFDNPVDFEANEEKGIGAPTLVFYPKTQTKTTSDSVIVGSFIVFKEDSMKALFWCPSPNYIPRFLFRIGYNQTRSFYH